MGGKIAETKRDQSRRRRRFWELRIVGSSRYFHRPSERGGAVWGRRTKKNNRAQSGTCGASAAHGGEGFLLLRVNSSDLCLAAARSKRADRIEEQPHVRPLSRWLPSDPNLIFISKWARRSEHMHTHAHTHSRARFGPKAPRPPSQMLGDAPPLCPPPLARSLDASHTTKV